MSSAPTGCRPGSSARRPGAPVASPVRVQCLASEPRPPRRPRPSNPGRSACTRADRPGAPVAPDAPWRTRPPLGVRPLGRRSRHRGPSRSRSSEGSSSGVYAAHITSGGVLDYETSTYFGVSGWREHPVYLRRRLPEPQRVDGTVRHVGDPRSHANYYHFLMDVLPRWGVLQETMPGVVPDVVLPQSAHAVPEAAAGHDRPRRRPAIEPTKHSAIQAERLLVPCTPNQDLMAPTWTTSWLRENLPPSTSARPADAPLHHPRSGAKNRAGWSTRTP